MYSNVGFCRPTYHHRYKDSKNMRDNECKGFGLYVEIFDENSIA